MNLHRILLAITVALPFMNLMGQIPEAEKIILPSYTKVARFARLQGNLKIKLTISSGKVTETTVDESTKQNLILKRQVLQLIEKWVFKKDYSGARTFEFRFILIPVVKDPKYPYMGAEDSEIQIEPGDIITITGKLEPSEPVVP